MLSLPDSWVWDFWLADDGADFHAFFLYASKALHDPDRRHRRASVGHAVSTDLVNWQRVADSLVRSDSPAFDDVAIWTGSCVRDDDGMWWMFYTGLSDDPIEGVQRISAATSDDLVTWTKVGRPLVESDARYYATAAATGEEPWRDPWVLRDDQGVWHMLITAKSDFSRDDLDNGVIAHATSEDLLDWTVLPPLTEPGLGFGQLEVPHVVPSGDGWALLFNCFDSELSPRRRSAAGGGIWAARAETPIGPFDVANARLISDSTRYVGKVIPDRAGVLQLLAFRNVEDGSFVGIIDDPRPFETVYPLDES